MLTLNQIVRRIKLIVLAHQQIRNFYYGAPVDFLTDQTTRYPSAFLTDVPAAVDLSQKTLTIGFRLFLLDLVNVSQNAKENELDVQSDMLSIALDLIAEFDLGVYTDWKPAINSPVTLVREQDNDLVAGAMLDFSILVPYDRDACVVPTDALPNMIVTESEKNVFDLVYTAVGDEDSTLSIPQIVGKKVLLVIRENNPIFRVSSSPDPAEYTWNDTVVGLGTPVAGAGERFLILYRNY